MKSSIKLLVITLAATLSPALAPAQNLFVSAGKDSSSQGVIYEYTTNGTQSIFASGLVNPGSLAFDSAGNLFEDGGGSIGAIYKYTTNGTRSTFATGLTNYAGLAFDSAGNLFVANQGTGNGASIFKYTPDGTRSAFASGLNWYPGWLAFDSAGNLFVTDQTDADGGVVYKFTPDGTQSVYASGLGYTRGLAFDSTGNLFVAGGGYIYKFTTNGVRSTFASSWIDASGLAIDTAGNVYAGSFAYGYIFEYTTNGTRSTFATGIWEPWFLAVQPVLAPPAITNSIASTTVSSGGSVTLAPGVSGTPPLSYQWFFNGSPMAGATNATLTITNFCPANVGSYFFTVSNALGGVTSQPATLASMDIKLFAGIVLNGPLGSNYVIQATSNLLGSWTTLTNVALPTQPYIYIDYGSLTNSQQFYRAEPAQ
jgi:sugar lactone lactonase YvrE